MAGQNHDNGLWERLQELEGGGMSKAEAVMTATDEGLLKPKAAEAWLRSMTAADAEPRAQPSPSPMAPSPRQAMPAPQSFPPSPPQAMPAPGTFPPSGAPAGGYAGPGPTFPPSGPPQMDPAMLAMLLRGRR